MSGCDGGSVLTLIQNAAAFEVNQAVIEQGLASASATALATILKAPVTAWALIHFTLGPKSQM